MLVKLQEGRRAGEVVEMPYHIGKELVEAGRAELVSGCPNVKVPEPQPQPETSEPAVTPKPPAASPESPKGQRRRKG
jgi:hypothetical protein